MHLLIGVLLNLILDVAQLCLLVTAPSLELIDVVSKLLLISPRLSILPRVESITLHVALNAVVGSIQELLAELIHLNVLQPALPAVLLCSFGSCVLEPFALFFDIFSPFLGSALASILVKSIS